MFFYPLVVKKGDFVVFKTEIGPDYEIPVRDLDSIYFVAEWFAHMAEKKWVTKEHIIDFARLVQKNIAKEADK